MLWTGQYAPTSTRSWSVRHASPEYTQPTRTDQLVASARPGHRHSSALDWLRFQVVSGRLLYWAVQLSQRRCCRLLLCAVGRATLWPECPLSSLSSSLRASWRLSRSTCVPCTLRICAVRGISTRRSFRSSLRPRLCPPVWSRTWRLRFVSVPASLPDSSYLSRIFSAPAIHSSPGFFY